MDTITQIALGAAVGEAVLGRKAGNRAPLWGAVAGIVPDLDVLANPLLNEVQEIAAHRGVTHSLLFSAAAAPALGWLLSRIPGNRKAGWKSWSLLVFLVLITHVFIDLCTSYGTRVLLPFSDVPLSLNSIFIVDPFYTVPLLAGIGTALFMGVDSRARRWVNYAGIGISSLYLLAGFALKGHVNRVFEENYKREGITAERYMTTPAPLTIFLWTGYGVSRDTIYAGLYSVFDGDRKVKLFKVPRRSELIAPYRDDLAVERLVWFSRGYYSVEQVQDGLFFSDLRFGRSDLWLNGAGAPFVWRYELEFNPESTAVTGFRHLEPSFETRRHLFDELVRRILGYRARDGGAEPDR